MADDEYIAMTRCKYNQFYTKIVIKIMVSEPA